eukprot:TRINITY_DN19288_c0_g1_i1.p1 TRINITY_DN19288_c0_g1~~TRINITY_DN19288_c0_g1_i1.p1  ORF type:complete len:736 (+),score=127.42 TRINITY_DN19288_c0_g1_i1:124-2331(+)
MRTMSTVRYRHVAYFLLVLLPGRAALLNCDGAACDAAGSQTLLQVKYSEQEVGGADDMEGAFDTFEDAEFLSDGHRSLEASEGEPEHLEILSQVASHFADKSNGPGAVWTEEEALIVMAKLYAMVKEWRWSKKSFVSKIECYSPPPVVESFFNITRLPCTHFPNWEGNNGRGFGRDPSFQMILRAGFHTCIPYEDGTGGCDGAAFLGLFPGGVFTQWGISGNFHRQKHPDDGKPGGVQQNANMALLWDALEELYMNKNFPPRAPALKKSLFESGKSRADLWAFATLVAVFEGFKGNNEKCDAKKTLYDVLPEDIRSDACKIKLSNALRFSSGRTDAPQEARPSPWTCASTCTAEKKTASIISDPSCKKGFPVPCGRSSVCLKTKCKGCNFCLPALDGTWRPRPYETLKPEAEAGAGMNGQEMADFFEKNFNFSKRETVAIMGSHSFAAFHPPVSGMHGYDWLHLQTGTLNNAYYRAISLLPSLQFELAKNGQRTPNANMAGTKAYGVGGVNSEPVKTAWATGDNPRSPSSGGVVWGHWFQRCPFCLNGKNIDRHRYKYGRDPDRCCALCEKATKTSGMWPPTKMIPRGDWQDTFKIEGLSKEEKTWFIDNSCMAPTVVHENAITADLGLAWKIHYDVTADGRMTGPKDSHGKNLRWMWNDTTEPNDLQDEGDLKMYEIVQEFATKQGLWAETFARTIEKMLANGAQQPLRESFVISDDISCSPSRGVWRCIRHTS